METLPASQAVESLVHEYGKLVFYTIYGLTGDWEESQDLTQDTFQQALKAIDAARETQAANGVPFHAKAWLLRIALNTVRMQQRRRSLFHFIPFSHMQQGRAAEMGDAGDAENEATEETLNTQAAPVQPGAYGTYGTDDPAELIAEQDAVRRTLAQLPEALRTCLLFSIVGGLSAHEIADLLGLKESAVRQRLVRARKQFQQLYLQESGEEVVDRTVPVERVEHAHNHSSIQRVAKERTERQKLKDGPHRPYRLTFVTRP